MGCAAIHFAPAPNRGVFAAHQALELLVEPHGLPAQLFDLKPQRGQLLLDLKLD